MRLDLQRFLTAPVALGHPEGPANPFHDARSTFAPEAQVGYFGQLASSSWLWGIKFRYDYLGATSTDRDIVVPQSGSSVAINGGAVTPLSGNVLIESSQTSINHELTLMAILWSFLLEYQSVLRGWRCTIWDKSNIYRAVGLADINGTPTDLTGAPLGFGSSNWAWGGAGQIGVTYDFAPTWFLDFNYTYAATGSYKANHSAPFNTTSAGLPYIGTAFITTTQRLTSQAFAISVNKVF